MAKGIVDLKKKNEVLRERAEKTGAFFAKTEVAPGASSNDTTPQTQPAEQKNTSPLISWEALEYRPRSKNPFRIAIPLMGAALIAAVALLARNYFLVVFIILAVAVFMVHFKRGPRKFTFQIFKDGFMAGEKRYSFNDLKSFWIFATPEGHELSLEVKRLWQPFIRVPLAADPAKVRELLKQVLPEEQHEDFLVDQIARRI